MPTILVKFGALSLPHYHQASHSHLNSNTKPTAMKKILSTTLVAAALATSAQAATTVFDFQFTTDNKKLNQVADDSGNGKAWNGSLKKSDGTTHIKTSGGVFDVLDPLKSTKKVLALGLTAADGIATLEVVFKNWAMDNTNTGDSIGFKLVGTGGTIGITWGGKDASNTRIRTSGTSGGKNATINSITGTSLKLKLVADLTAGTFQSFYDIGSGYVDNTGSAGANGITTLDDVNLSVGAETGTAWTTEGNADHAEIDSITLTTLPVPEPSSTALLGLGGLALLLRRRK